ncbi:Basic-leucine zipper domain [Sesbania bispinosa]|nr:Basic-leucine zipper domain [Sesbania bispinosa]
MGKEESNRTNKFGTPYKFMVPQDVTHETLNKPIQPLWTTSMQAHYNPGLPTIPILNPHAANSYLHRYVLPNQANSTLLQRDAPHDPSKLSNKIPPVKDAALAFSEMVHKTFGEKSQCSMERIARTLQPENLMFGEARKNGSGSSIPKNDTDGMSRSAATGNKGSPDETHDTNNDFPSTKEDQSNIMLGNENSTLNQNSETGLNASGTTACLTELDDEDEIRRERKRQSNRESAKRSKLRKLRECKELHKDWDTLKDENSLLTQELKMLSEECLELSNENDAIQIHTKESSRYVVVRLGGVQKLRNIQEKNQQ